MVDRDRELVQALRVGDAGAVERLVATYGDRAYRLASRITRNAADAEEIVQDAFVAVVRKIETFRGDAAFGSWMYRIVANAAYRRLRGQRARYGHVSLDALLPRFDERGRHVLPVADWSPAVADPHAQAELRLALARPSRSCPRTTVRPWCCTTWRGRSNLEIAEALNLSVPNVKSRVHRARLFLRRRLGEHMARRRLPRSPEAAAKSSLATACA